MLAVAASLIHFGGVLLSPFVALVHLVVLRVYVVREARHYLGPTRRLFTRWAARFAFLWLGLPGYAAMAVPLAGIVSGAATFVVLTEVVHVYTAWSLAREQSATTLAGVGKGADGNPRDHHHRGDRRHHHRRGGDRLVGGDS